MSSHVLCIDLGGTQIRSAVVDRDGRLLSRARTMTPQAASPDAGIQALLQTAHAAMEQSPIREVACVGLSAVGPISPRTGIMYAPPNVSGWSEEPVSEIIAREFELPCFAGNDANLAALAEWQFGAGRGSQDVVYLTVSTGIGSGVISGGRLIEGKDGLAAEAGHIILEPDGPLCGCGNYGCLEALASGSGIARRAEERLARGEGSVLQSQRGHVTARDVADAAVKGDSLAKELFHRAATYLGLGIASLINVFNPSVVILGGGLTNAGELLFGPVRKVAHSRCMPMLGRDTQIARAALGENVGLLGAAVYAFDRLPPVAP
jgi:glucokinase